MFADWLNNFVAEQPVQHLIWRRILPFTDLPQLAFDCDTMIEYHRFYLLKSLVVFYYISLGALQSHLDWRSYYAFIW